MLLQDKVAVVTGGGRGIGRAVVAALAEHGARVVICDKGTAVASSASSDPSVASAAAAEVRAAGGEARAATIDVTDLDAVEQMMGDAVAEWGRIDILVNAAGIIRDRMIWNVPSDEWDDVMSVHLKSCYTTVRSLARHVRASRDEQRDVSIVTFTSSAGIFGNVGSSSYGAAKAGVVGFTRVVAQELRGLGVRANCVLPFAWTRMAAVLPNGDGAADKRLERLRALDAGHVANLVVFLASGAEPRLTGQVLGMRGKELLVVGQPRIDARIVLAETDPQSLTEILGGRLTAHLAPLQASGEVFDYEPYL